MVALAASCMPDPHRPAVAHRDSLPATSSRVTKDAPSAIQRASSNTAPCSRATAPWDSVDIFVEIPAKLHGPQRVKLALKIRNENPERVCVGLAVPPPAYDLVVRTPEGKEVWSRWYTPPGAIERGIHEALRVYDLAPGEALELSDEWYVTTNQGEPVPPGTYYLQGSLLGVGQPPPTTEPVEFVVVR